MKSADTYAVPELRQAWKCFVAAGMLAGVASMSWLLLETILDGKIQRETKIFLGIIALYFLGSLHAFRKTLSPGLFLVIALLLNFVGLLACSWVLQAANGWLVIVSAVPLMWMWFRAAVAVVAIHSQRW